MDSLHYFYLGAVVPIGLIWAALQDFVLDAHTPQRRALVRRIGQLLALVGLAHPAVAWVGLDMVRAVSCDEYADEPGAASSQRRATTLIVVSLVLAAAGAAAWFLR